jgi:DNA invertase Pin-like site-specific DNA recombinase
LIAIYVAVWASFGYAARITGVRMEAARHTGAVLYLRVSTTEQADGPLNLINQERKCQSYCAQKGYTVLQMFVDPGESARTADRPAFQRMIAYCKAHKREVGYRWNID